uniref:UDP-glucuronosyltransferase n=1 Tax=Aotus nancymaae TaxID=37293 RepID=A0A2K5CWX6_AOTNA
MSVKWTSVLLLIQLSFYFGSGHCGNVLVWAPDFSHWMNMKTILNELVQRGHEVTVLAKPASILVDPNNPSTLKLEVFPTSLTKTELDNIIIQQVKRWSDLPKDNFWSYFSQVQEMAWIFSDIYRNVCKDLVSNKKLMKKLQESRFDVIFADAIFPGGELLAGLLNIPFVYSLSFSIGYTLEKHGGGFLFPPSYVPVVISELSDRMTFMERVKNMIYMLYFDFWFQLFDMKKWDQFYSEVLGRPTTLCETVGKADIWLIRTNWDFEFPQPYQPNFEFVGGLHCKPVKPLPKEMEEFVQSSGEDGIVVFSLGSLLQNVPEEKANIIASALAQIPQKVLWRYKGKTPSTLGTNTQLYDWIPQNDLLGHPKTKAFVTHGGINGIYEAIYHGVPMVGIPIFGDQPDNIAHMKAKGAAVEINFKTMTSEDLLRALRTVINDSFYKENAMRLSRIHHEQPVKPLDRAAFWIEFVMRHKGAKHLRPAVHNLTWFQHYSIDVIGFLLACVVTAIFLVTKCCLFSWSKFNKTRKIEKRE